MNMLTTLLLADSNVKKGGPGSGPQGGRQPKDEEEIESLSSLKAQSATNDAERADARAAIHGGGREHFQATKAHLAARAAHKEAAKQATARGEKHLAEAHSMMASQHRADAIEHSNAHRAITSATISRIQEL